MQNNVNANFSLISTKFRKFYQYH